MHAAMLVNKFTKLLLLIFKSPLKLNICGIMRCYVGFTLFIFQVSSGIKIIINLFNQLGHISVFVPVEGQLEPFEGAVYGLSHLVETD